MINTSQIRVLLVDDDKFLLDMYCMKFQAQGFVVHASLSVADALKALDEGFVPDAIIFDLVMPENDGFALLSALKAKNLVPEAIRIALTNESDDSARAKASELGADKVIEKASMIPTEVVNIVSELIAGKHKV